MPRQPMIGLAVSAGAGILCAENLTLHPALMGVVCLLVGWLIWRLRSTGLVLILSGLIFFSLHLIQSKGSPGLALARQLGSESHPVQAIGIVTTIPELMTTGKHRFQLRLESIGDPPQPCSAPVLVNWRGIPPALGDRLEFTAQARNLPAPVNPGQFDQPAYYNRHGIYSELRMRFPMDGKVTGSGYGNPAILLAARARNWMQQQLRTDLDGCPEIAGLIQSLVLGLKEETPEPIRELFQRTGTMHLFVVNGLHVGLFAAIVWHLLKPLGFSQRHAVFLIVPIIAFYSLVTGLSPGSIRATIMACIFFGGHLFERKPRGLNSLAAAAFAILLWNTQQLFMPGFQFSFGVVLAILLLATRFRQCLARLGQPDPFLPRLLWNRRQHITLACSYFLSGLAGVSLAAWIGSLPFSLVYFHLVTPSAVVANLFIVPAAFVILGQGILTMSTACVSHWVATIFSNANWLAATVLLRVVGWFAIAPGGHLYLEMPTLHPPEIEITIFDCGRGGAIHIRSQEQDWLFDCANSAQFNGFLRNYLHNRGINQLDGLLLSHGHIANVGAALEVIDQFHPKQIIDSPLTDRAGIRKTIQEGMKLRRLPSYTVSRGDFFQLSPQTKVKILYPPAGLLTRTADDRSLVIQMKTFGQRVLWMFDSGYQTEAWLLENEPDLECDILIKGMHATDISASSVFLRATKPRLLVCSTGGNAGFCRIPPEWNYPGLFRQDQTGAVIISIRSDQTIFARSFLGNQTYP